MFTPNKYDNLFKYLICKKFYRFTELIKGKYF